MSFAAAVEQASAKLQARRSAVALPQCSPLRTYFRLKYSQYGCSTARWIFAPAFAATVESALGSRQNRRHTRQGQPLPHDRSSNTAHIGLMLTVPQAALRIGAYVVVDLDDTVPLIDEKICSDQTCAFHAKARRIKTAASQ